MMQLLSCTIAIFLIDQASHSTRNHFLKINLQIVNFLLEICGAHVESVPSSLDVKGP